MALGELTAEQRQALEKELRLHYVADVPPFEKCSCGGVLNAGRDDIGAHRLEVAFQLGFMVAKRPKPRRKVIPASEVLTGHEIMSGRRRVLVTQVFTRTLPDGTSIIDIAGTYKPKPSALRPVSTGFQVRPGREFAVMNWLPPGT